MKKSLNLLSDLKDTQKAFVAIFLGSLLGGATAAVTKIGLVGFPPFSFVFLRFFVAGICLLPFISLGKKNIKRYLKLIPLSLLATVNILLFILGIKSTTATIGQLLYAATPFLIAVFMYSFLKEKINSGKAIGIIIGFMGTLIVVVLPVTERGNPFSGNLFGNVLIGLGVLSWSLYMVYSKSFLRKYSPLDITFMFIFTTVIASFPFFLFDLINRSGWYLSLTINSLLAFAYITIISTIVTYFLNQYAIKHGGAIFASLSFYLLPIFAFIFAFLLLGEHLTSGLIFGGLLVLLGVFITTSK